MVEIVIQRGHYTSIFSIYTYEKITKKLLWGQVCLNENLIKKERIMRKKLLVLLFVVLMIVPASRLAAGFCDLQLKNCLMAAIDPAPCYAQYRECQDASYF